MTFDEYQQQAITTAIHHPNEEMDRTIWVLGLVGEAGEVVEKWKKIVAYRKGAVSEEDILEIKKEIGDVLWYASMLADSLGLKLDDIARLNLDKLASRKVRGTQRGSGDNR